MDNNNPPQFVLCINNAAYPASLEVRKIYRSVPDPVAESRRFVRVIDESGEDYLYPADCFLPLELSRSVEEALLQVC